MIKIFYLCTENKHLMKRKEGFLFLGFVYKLILCYTALCGRVFSLLFFTFSFLAFSQEISNDVSVKKSDENKLGVVVVSSNSQIHVVGEAFVFVGGKVIKPEKKQRNSVKISRKKTIVKNRVKPKRAPQKTFVPKLPNVSPRIHSSEEDSEFFASKNLMVKVAVSFGHDISSRLYCYTISVKKNMELLYQKKVYFYSSHIGKLNFSEAFSVRPPPFI